MSVHPNADAVIKAILQDSPPLVKAALAEGGHYDDELLGAPLTPNQMHAVHIAAANNKVEVATWLCSVEGLDLNAATIDNGWTPAHFAAFNGHERICALLKHNEAKTDTTDFYGDTPCDVALAVNAMAAVDVLGGNATIREARAKFEQERQRLVAEARALEEDRINQAKRRAAEEEAKRVAEAKRKERIKRAKELRAILEKARLELIAKWLRSREAAERDVLSNLEWLFASQILMAHDLISTEIKAKLIALAPSSLIDVPQPEVEAAAVDPAAVSTKSKLPAKKGKPSAKSPKRAAGGKVGKNAAATPALTSASDQPSKGNSSTNVSPGLAASAEFDDDNDPELQMPVFTGVMTKEKKKEMAKIKARIERIKKERRIARQQAAEQLRQQFAEEVVDLENEETMMRNLGIVDWDLAVAKLCQLDSSKDRRHPGVFVYHSEEPVCSCGHPTCKPGTMTWSCCGLPRPDTVGCAVVDDTTKPPFHPGTFAFHMEGCTCTQTAAVQGRTREVVRTLVNLKSLGKTRAAADDGFAYSSSGSSSDEDGATQSPGSPNSVDATPIFSMDAEPSDAFAIDQPATLTPSYFSKAAAKHPAQSRAVRFCNPGGTVWSCCGSIDNDADGCMMQKRFLYVENVLLFPSFVESTEWARSHMPAQAFRKNQKQWYASLGGTEITTERLLGNFCNVLISGDRRNVVSHKVPVASPTSVTRCTVVGHTQRQIEKQALSPEGSLDDRRISCFEVQIVTCPTSPDSSEQMVVGWMLQSAFIGKGGTLGSSNGLGWWAQTTHFRGLGVSIEAGDAYRELDVVCMAIDHVNGFHYCFKNRKLVSRTPFRAPGILVPAVTLVAGCEIRCDDSVGTRNSVTYVEDFIRHEQQDGYHQRMFGAKAPRYQSLFRDKFDIEKAKREPVEGLDDDEEDCRINFDV